MPSATIANGAALSGAVDLGSVIPGNEIVGLVMPIAWTAAAMTFQGSADGTNFYDLYNDAGTELNFTVGASQAIGLRQDARAILGRWRHIKVRSGTTGTPMNQGAERVITLIVK